MYDKEFPCVFQRIDKGLYQVINNPGHAYVSHVITVIAATNHHGMFTNSNETGGQKRRCSKFNSQINSRNKWGKQIVATVIISEEALSTMKTLIIQV